MSKNPKRGWFDYAVLSTNVANLLVRIADWLDKL